MDLLPTKLFQPLMMVLFEMRVRILFTFFNVAIYRIGAQTP